MSIKRKMKAHRYASHRAKLPPSMALGRSICSFSVQSAILFLSVKEISRDASTKLLIMTASHPTRESAWDKSQSSRAAATQAGDACGLQAASLSPPYILRHTTPATKMTTAQDTVRMPRDHTLLSTTSEPPSPSQGGPRKESRWPPLLRSSLVRRLIRTLWQRSYLPMSPRTCYKRS